MTAWAAQRSSLSNPLIDDLPRLLLYTHALGSSRVAIVYGLSVGINRALFSIVDSLGFVCAGSSAPAEAKGQETPIFATKTLCHPTTVTVTKNQTYLITLKIMVLARRIQLGRQ
jgi:hypothetical protein